MLFEDPEPGTPPPPPPAPAQLVIAKVLATRSATSISTLRRRLYASGAAKRAHIAGRIRASFCVLNAEAAEMPVAIFTATVPVVFAPTVSLGGLKLQAELAGSAVQAKVNVPLEPLIGVKVTV